MMILESEIDKWRKARGYTVEQVKASAMGEGQLS